MPVEGAEVAGVVGCWFSMLAALEVIDLVDTPALLLDSSPNEVLARLGT